MQNKTLKETVKNFLEFRKITEVPKSFTKATGLKTLPSLYFLLDAFTRQYSAALSGFSEDGLELYFGLLCTEVNGLNKALLEIASLTELERTFQTSEDSERNNALRADIENFVQNFLSVFPHVEMTNESLKDFLTNNDNDLVFEFYKEFIGKHSVYGLVYHHLNNRSEPLDYNTICRLFKAFNNLPNLNRDTFILSASNIFSTLAADKETCTIVDSAEQPLSTNVLNALLLSKPRKIGKAT